MPLLFCLQKTNGGVFFIISVDETIAFDLCAYIAARSVIAIYQKPPHLNDEGNTSRIVVYWRFTHNSPLCYAVSYHLPSGKIHVRFIRVAYIYECRKNWYYMRDNIICCNWFSFCMIVTCSPSSSILKSIGFQCLFLHFIFDYVLHIANYR